MKKSLLAVGLTLSMVLAMATPAFAATTEPNANGDAVTEVTLPGSPDYVAGTNPQTQGQSYNQASMTSANGTDWLTANDDDKIAKATDVGGADINVWAKVVDSGSKVYKVDLAWGAMKFEYKDASGQWNTTTHAYDAGTDTNKGWTASYVDGTNNKVAITNHSNNAINAAFAYAMDSKVFNDAAGANNVDGNFFADNAKAVTASKVLAGTYDATGANEIDTAVLEKLKTAVALPTADKYNSTTGTGNATDATNDKPAAAREDAVYFAFSGTPDAGKGKTLDTFKKVGVITVTVTPNNDVPLNRPPFTK